MFPGPLCRNAMVAELFEEPKPSADLSDKVRQTYLQHESPASEAETQTAAEHTPPPAQTAEDELAQLKQQYEELHERYLRLAADFDNYRKRMLREREAWAETLTEHFLRQLLPILDQLEMALDSQAPEDALRRGVELIYRNMVKLLETLGVKPIEIAPGQPFDVYYHEAVARLPSEFPEGVIVKELQRGYLFRERVLRHARVAVSAGPSDDHQPHQQDGSQPEAPRDAS